MADNVQVVVGTGDAIRTDDIGGVQFPCSKITLGNNNTDDGFVSDTNPLPTKTNKANLDAFSRLRTSSPHTVFDIKHTYHKQPLLETEVLVGSATSVHSQIDANITLSVSANNDSVIRQTRQSFNYQPGKSQLIYLTGTLGAKVADTRKCIGLFDSNNGLFFDLNGSVLGVTIRKDGSDTTTVQDDWNLDKLDGTGISGATLDTTKTQIFVIDFEWLGVGNVRYGFVINGVVLYCHESVHSNTDTSTYMSTPVLPIRYQIGSTGGTSSMTQICSTVISEGGSEDTGILRGYGTGPNKLDANVVGTNYAIVGLRLATGLANTHVDLSAMSILSVSKDDIMWTLCFNPTVAGTFEYSGIPDSAMEGALGVTANTISDFGHVLQQEYMAEETHISEDVHNSIAFGLHITGKADEIVLAITPITSTNLDVFGSLAFIENL